MPTADAAMEHLIDTARRVARDALGRLSTEDKSEALTRLDREPHAPGIQAPRVVVMVELTQSAWSLSIRVGGARPLEVATASGVTTTATD
jgi:hypothetical protein